MIITANFIGPQQAGEIAWHATTEQRGATWGNMQNSSQKNEAKETKHAWQYKAYFPVSATVWGAPKEQMTFNGVPQFINDKKEFVIEWEAVNPLEITLLRLDEAGYTLSFDYFEDKREPGPLLGSCSATHLRILLI